MQASESHKSPLRRAADVVRARPAVLLAAAFVVLPLAAFLLLPVFLAIGSGFVLNGRPSGYWLWDVLRDSTILRQFLNGLLLACTATALCLLLGVPLAVVRARCRFRGQGFLSVALLLPLILPPFVGGLAIEQMLAKFGMLNRLLAQIGVLSPAENDWPNWLRSKLVGVAIMQALHLFPILYLNASAALANVDPAYTQAARNLGAGPLRTFFRVTLPLIRPGLFAGATIVFLWSFTDIGTPLTVDFRNLVPVAIFEKLAGAEYHTSGKTFAMVFVMLGAAVLIYGLGKLVFGRPIEAGGGKATVQAETRRLGPVGTAAAWLGFGLVLVLAVLPHAVVVVIALADTWIKTPLPSSWTTRHMAAVFQSQSTYTSILNSLKYAGISTGVDLVLGGLAAWLIVRSKVPGRRALDCLAMLPLAVPGVILAAGYVAMTVPGSPLESIGPMANPFGILVVAYSVRRLPFVVRGVSAGLEQVPETLEEAAWNLGAGKARAAWRITLPLIAANVIAAGVLTFAFAMLEVSDSLILAQRSQDYPITREIYDLFKSSATGEGRNVAAALGVYGMALLGGTMALASTLLGRRLGAIFRA